MNKLFSTVLAGACVALSSYAIEASSPDLIIPRPAEIKIKEDTSFIINEWTALICESQDSGFIAKTEVLRAQLNKGTDLTFSAYDQVENCIRIVEDKSLAEYGKEAYTLTVTAQNITIGACAPEGIFYAGQSLIQLMSPEFFKKEFKPYKGWTIPAGFSIKDYPRFAWRSLLIDEARHFYGMATTKEIIDQMALLKMNTLHFHICDDGGWRMEIKKYPRLTQVGSKRANTEIGGWGSGRRSGKPHQGFYTQEQLKELVRYAAERNVTIVPEVAMPGHASGIVAAYPELGTDKTPITTPEHFGKLPSVLDPTSEKTYEFLEDVINEVCEIFPSEIIHIGGDEVLYKQWNESPAVQKLAKEKGFSNTNTDVQVYFTNKMAKIIEKKGRRIMGWNEIMGRDLHGQGVKASTNKLAPNTVIHFWKGGKDLAISAIKEGYEIVNSNHSNTYLDYGSITLPQAYFFNPMFEGLTPEQEKKVIGSGCQAWGEWMPNRANMESKVFPRLAAYAETFWTPTERKDYKSFVTRLKLQIERWDYTGVVYNKNAINVQPEIRLEDMFNNTEIQGWTKSNLEQGFIEIDITKHIKKGKMKAFFFYTQGANAAIISNVQIFADGKEIAKDAHEAFSGIRKKDIEFKLDINTDPVANTKYTLKASIKGSDGNDSKGRIFITFE